MKNTIIVVFSIIAFLLCAVFALEVEEFGTGNLRVTNDRLFVEIVGNQNVPKFTFRRFTSGSPTVSYRVKFQHLYESANVNTIQRLPATQIALPSLRWSFSDWKIEDKKLHFTITGTGRGDFDSVQFFVHIPEEGDDFKFDVRLNGFGSNYWTSDAGAVVLGYKIQELNANGEEDVSLKSIENNSRYEVEFGRRGYLVVEKEAYLTSDQNKERSFDVRVFTQGNGMIYNTYERFAGSLTHDPTLGYREEDNEGLNEAQTNSAPQSGVAFTAILASVALLWLW